MNNLHEKEMTKLSSHVREVLRSPQYILPATLLLSINTWRAFKRPHGCADSISDAEIEGAFEMVTEHLFPYSADEMEQIMALTKAREEPEVMMLEQTQQETLSNKVLSVLGKETLMECSKVQLEMMDSLMDQRLERMDNDPNKITDSMIRGMYEMVMDHLQPIDLPK